MKMHSLRSIAVTALASVLLALSASRASAALDMYLKLEGVKGEARKIEVKPDGTFDSGKLPAGQYSFSWGTSQAGSGRITAGAIAGIVVSHEVKSPRDVATGQSSGKQVQPVSPPRDVASGLPTGKRSTEVVSPRDAASGLPTGRRMHKPFTITKEFDKASPQLATKLGVINLDEDCDGITGKLELKTADGKAASLANWDLAVAKK